MLVMAASARAVVITDLYSATVPVADYGQSGLQTATREALAEVIVKVSGTRQSLSSEVVRRALPRGRDYLLQYQYLPGDDGLFLEIAFDPSLVTGLMVEAREPVWTAQRPPLLVWLAVDAVDGRNYVTSEAPEGLLDALQTGFKRRAVPARFPLLDLPDAMALTPDEIWNMQAAPAVQASQRYAASDVLLGRLTQASDGRWLGEWTYLWPDGRAEQSGFGVELEEFATLGVALVAEKMAARYAVVPTALEQSGIRLGVDGVTTFAQYRSLYRYLESVELVDAVHAQQVRGDQLVFVLQANASADQLKPVLALNRSLLMVQEPVLGSRPLAVDLHYQWVP